MDSEKFLFSLSRFGIKLGLGPTLEFARSIGNPQDSFRSIHVAGSNGKGSTATFIYRVLKRRYRAALYTSPHLRRFNERIIVNDEEVPDSFIDEFVSSHKSTIEYNENETQLTFFEYTTIMAFDFFRKKGVEFASVEVGLGGRLDSTNIIKPEVSVITSISLEHADKLGGSIEYIAREKGGIIKKGTPVVIGKVPETAQRVLLNIARQNNSPVREAGECEVSNLQYTLEGTSFLLKTENNTYEVNLKALGEHQVNNAISTVLAAESMPDPLSVKEIIGGLAEAQVPGRFEIRRRNPLLILDGAHNPEAMHSLASNIRRYGIKDPLIVLGVLKDKNSYNIMQTLSEISEEVLITEPNEVERKKDVEDLRREAKLFFKEVEISRKPSGALDIVLKGSRDAVVTGSLYLVGEVESLLDEKEREEGVPLEGEEFKKPSGLVE